MQVTTKKKEKGYCIHRTSKWLKTNSEEFEFKSSPPQKLFELLDPQKVNQHITKVFIPNEKTAQHKYEYEMQLIQLCNHIYPSLRLWALAK